MSQPTTLDLMAMYATCEQQLAALKQQSESLSAFQATIAKQLTDRLDPNDMGAQFAHTFPDGRSVSVARKVQERWVPIDGQSDDFWGWVFKAGVAEQFCPRTLKQEGVDQWRAAHKTQLMPDGELPPFIKRMTIVSPKIGVKGLTKPSTPSVPAITL